MKKNIVIGILLVLVIGLAGYLGYDKFLKKEESVEEQKIPQTEKAQIAKDVKGLYTFTSEPIYAEEKNENVEVKYELYLYEDGTFEYSFSSPYSGHIGNYIIKDNKIIINYMFDTAMDTSLNYNGKTKILSINDDGTLTDNENEVSVIENDAIILTKASDQDENEFLNNHYKVNKMISDFSISNNSEQ